VQKVRHELPPGAGGLDEVLRAPRVAVQVAAQRSGHRRLLIDVPGAARPTTTAARTRTEATELATVVSRTPIAISDRED